MAAERSALSLVLNSHVDVLDYVQVVCDQLCASAQLNEDAGHWVGVSVRESVVNAIRHGNKFDPAKHVRVHFAFVPAEAPEFLEVSVQDEGEGFEPEEVADPLAPGEPAEIQRPRYLLHAQLHGRRPVAPSARRRHGSPHAQAPVGPC